MMEKNSLRQAYGKRLAELAVENSNIVVFDADLSGSTQTVKVLEKTPKQHFNMGIAENNMCLVAAGMSRVGKTVFLSSFAMFVAGRSWEMIRNSIVYDNLNVKIVVTHAGISVGEDGASHQMNEDIALMRTLPGLEVIVPCDQYETVAVINYVVKHSKPVYIRLSRDKGYDVFDSSYEYKPGEVVILEENKSLSKGAIFTTGLMTGIIKVALEDLKSENIYFSHYHIPSIKPLNDRQLQDIVQHYEYLVTFEEHTTIGGLGDAVLSAIATNPKKLFKHGIFDVFGESGTVSDLFDAYSLSVPKVKEVLLQYYQNSRSLNA